MACSRAPSWRPCGGPGRPRRSARRPCRTGAARTAGPGRSSPSSCRAAGAPSSGSAPTSSSPSSQICRRSGRVRAWCRPRRPAGHRLAGAGLADDAEGPARSRSKDEPVDGLDQAVVGREVDPQVLTSRNGRAGGGRRRTADAGRLSGHLVPHPRVDDGVQQVHDQVADDDEEGGDQGHAEHLGRSLSLMPSTA